ncbi:terminase DNA packaging enzyme small subunit [Aeromonas phage AsFcp_4]|uniref:Gp16 terminase DNA packaging enzyme small subunit n=1 Tax=Aeromonas phage PX29 TaxID=926067 RepID=E5DQE3_9CAUD|nr:terminase small subunit [Aeromonas phage PX29]ADQ52929.1 gp16 terminase DNA packaging enzyme small subunit [Aeromonas phage PX29]QAX98469.1 terminase DNA packaging enzyme small subunit [Aeromonas phage AsFcp_2]QAX99501.1 terminase DNA packaging enzyme small subunit [Aeromonas phage AsFcp_4]
MNDLNMQQLLDVTGIPGMSFDDTMPVVYEPTVLEPVDSHPAERSKDLESDYDLVRQTLNFQQQMLMAMGKIALENAKNSESPKHVDAFVNLMNSMTNVSKEILKVHKEMGAITNETTKTKDAPQQAAPSMNIEHATVFVGTPAELMAQEGTQSEALSRSKQVIEGESDVVDA